MPRSVSVVVPCLTEHRWQADLTRACIDIARHTTEVPYELVVAEAVGAEPHGSYFAPSGQVFATPLDRIKFGVDKHFFNPNKGNANGDTNTGMNLCEGEIIVVLTNDVFVKPGWLEYLLECFDRFPDCGMASLGTTDHTNERAVNAIVEGVWCPVFAIPNRPEFRFDAMEFPSEWGDYDLLMRIYQAGLRSYRNLNILCNHLGRATNGNASDPEKAARIEEYRQKFLNRWGPTPQSSSIMFRALMSGWIV